MRDELVAANALFHDFGDLRKPEYLYQIVQDALEQGREMQEEIEKRIRESGLSVTDEHTQRIVLWNRREKKEHTVDEIKGYLASPDGHKG